jgi:hypothetical protein
MIIPLDFREQVEKCIQDNTGKIFKKFFDEENNPKWEDILQCFHSEIKKEKTTNFTYPEKPYGNVLVSDDLYIVSHLKEIEKYFPKLIKVQDQIRKLSGISMSTIGPKVCIGPHYVNFHKDQWHAFALHSEGKAKWTLSDTQDGTGLYFEEFYPERGDLIFFPKGMWHKIETQDSPRAGIQFNANINNELF